MSDDDASEAPDSSRTPSRRDLVRSIGLLPVAALPTWMGDALPRENIILISGWILTDTDLFRKAPVDAN